MRENEAYQWLNRKQNEPEGLVWCGERLLGEFGSLSCCEGSYFHDSDG
jgi:hypothetical protein